MGRPEISVIISARNERRTVREAIASLLDQTFKPFEIIFIDDASTDGTAERVESFKDKRIHILRRNASEGLTANLRMACRRARGRFLARMDADDVSEPERLSVLFRIMDESPDLGFAASRAHVIDERGRRIGFLGAAVEGKKLNMGLLACNVIVHGSAMIRAEALANAGGYRVAFRFAQDYDLWLRLAEKWRGCVLGDVLYNWRLRKGSIGSSRRAEQMLFADLARNLARERTIHGREITDLDSTAANILRGHRPSGFRNLYRTEQLLWAATLYAGSAYRAAFATTMGLLKRDPASPAVWRFLWDKYARVMLSNFIAKGKG